MSKKIWYAPHKFDCYSQEEIDNVVNCLQDGWLSGTGKYTIQFEKDIFSVRYVFNNNFVNSASLKFKNLKL